LENCTDETYDNMMAETTKAIEDMKPGEWLAGAYYDRGIIHGGKETAVFDYVSAIQLNCAATLTLTITDAGRLICYRRL
jgi:hypothetical protein